MCDFMYDFGDILWCNREFDCHIDDELHKEGPFIFLCSDDNYAYCFKGSGNNLPGFERTNYYNFILGPENSPLRKKTEFNTSTIHKVPFSSIINYLDTVDEECMNELIKRIHIGKRRGCYDPVIINSLNLSFTPSVGDVFAKKDQRFVVIKHENNNYYLVPFSGSEGCSFKFDFDNEFIENDFSSYNLDTFLEVNFSSDLCINILSIQIFKKIQN